MMINNTDGEKKTGEQNYIKENDDWSQRDSIGE